MSRSLGFAQHVADAREVHVYDAGARVLALQRVMRALASIGVFAIERDGRFRNNRLSSALRSARTGTFRDFADYFGSASNVRAAKCVTPS